MNKKIENKSNKQFKPTRPKFASMVWFVTVFILIASMLISSIFLLLLFLLPQPKQNNVLDEATIRQLQEQINSQQNVTISIDPSATETPTVTPTVTK